MNLLRQEVIERCKFALSELPSDKQVLAYRLFISQFRKLDLFDILNGVDNTHLCVLWNMLCPETIIQYANPPIFTTKDWPCKKIPYLSLKCDYAYEIKTSVVGATWCGIYQGDQGVRRFSFVSFKESLFKDKAKGMRPLDRFYIWELGPPHGTAIAVRRLKKCPEFKSDVCRRTFLKNCNYEIKSKKLIKGTDEA